MGIDLPILLPSATFFSWRRHFELVKCLAWFATALLLATAMGCCPSASAETEPTARAAVLHVSIFNDSVALEGNDSDRSVRLAGDVLVDFVYFVTVRVVLSGSTDLGWPVSVEPPSMTFSTSVAQYFNATVTIPGGTYNRSATLTVRGNATIPPGVPEDTASDTAVINVLGNGDGSGQPPLNNGRAGRTGVYIPPFPLILGAVTAAAAFVTVFVLWFRKIGRIKKPIMGRKGPHGRRPAAKPPRDV